MSLTVTQILDHFYPFDVSDFNIWCRENGVIPEKVSQYSANFGTIIHETILEEKRTLFSEQDFGIKQEYISMTLDHWFKLKEKFRIKILNSETDISYIENGKRLYRGRRDSIMSINGVNAIVDLKTFGAWRIEYPHLPEKEEYLDPAKKTHTNIQTMLYALPERKKLSRYVVNINPFCAEIHEFKRDPTKKIEEILQYCREQYDLNNF